MPFIGNAIAIGNRRGGFNSTIFWLTNTPSNLVLTVISDTEIQLDWTAGVGGLQDGHSIERTVVAGGLTGWAEIATVTGATVHYHNTGLTEDTLYYYRIRAYKGANYSAYSNVDFETTWPTEYRTIWNALTTKPFQLDANYQAAFLKALLDGGVWSTKLDSFFFLQQTTNGASEALKDWRDLTHTGTLAGATNPEFTPNVGFLMKVADSRYIDTLFIPSAGTNYTLNNASIIIYIVNNVDSPTYETACYDGTYWTQITLDNGGPNQTSICLNGGNVVISNSSTQGLWIINRISSTQLDIYHNGAKVGATNTSAVQAGLATNSYYLGTRHNPGAPSGFSNGHYGIVGYGGTFTLAQVVTFTNAFNAYNSRTYGHTLLTPIPSDLNQHGFESCNGKLYAIGGNKQTGGVVNVKTCFEYDPIGNSWATKTALPLTGAVGIQSPILRAVNNKLYFIGGSLTGNTMQNTCFEYDPSIDTWTTKTPMPTVREDFGSAVYGGKIYCFGGLTTGATPIKTMEVYDPVTDTWDETKADLPVEKWSGDFGCTCNGKIYAISSAAVYAGYPTITPVTTVYCYDPIADSWSTKAVMPLGILYKECAVIGTNIYVVGGQIAGDYTLASTKSRGVYKYDTIADTWSLITNVPYDALGISVTELNDKIYICGGEDYSGYTSGHHAELYRLNI